jgi:hypothetical protein
VRFGVIVGRASRLTSSIAKIPLHLSWPEGKAGRLTYPSVNPGLTKFSGPYCYGAKARILVVVLGLGRFQGRKVIATGRLRRGTYPNRFQ